ncbi:hypothetical protein Salat_2628700 [Sesamum alatum]|uniref:RNase H type-1 domain-containing protein n=1 Tax=Sesamum alatum TaxID=300844 RepID=A0AAE1XNN9_9LAMI|nr:hypothetical protein Salat_2628700 [Sesamum alatum]
MEKEGSSFGNVSRNHESLRMKEKESTSLGGRMLQEEDNHLNTLALPEPEPKPNHPNPDCLTISNKPSNDLIIPHLIPTSDLALAVQNNTPLNIFSSADKKGKGKLSGRNIVAVGSKRTSNDLFAIDALLSNLSRPDKKYAPSDYSPFWIKYAESAKIVAKEWSAAGNGTKAKCVQENLNNCRVGLLNWSKDRFGNIWKRIEEIEGRIKENNRGRITEDSKKRDRMLRAEGPRDGISTVTELILADGQGWNEELIREHVWDIDSEAILAIPLGRGPNDRLSQKFFLCFCDAIRAEPKGRKVHIPVVWSKPPNGWIKLNFDGALSKDRTFGTVGVIARNARGECVGWKARLLSGFTEAVIIEAEAARTAADLVIQQGWDQVILEGDCQVVINSATLASNCSVNIWPIIFDIQQLLGSVTHRWSQVHRTGNKAAHRLAQIFKFQQDCEYLHPDVFSAINVDLNYGN